MTELGALVGRPGLIGAGAAVVLVLRGRQHLADLVVEACDVGRAAEGLGSVEPAGVVVGRERAVGVVAAGDVAVLCRRGAGVEEDGEERR